MKLLNAITVTMLTLSISTSILADEIKTTHTVGFNSGGGGLEYKGKNTDSQGVGQSYLYYNYQFMPNYYAEVALIGAVDIDDWQCKNNTSDELECYTDDSDNFELKADNFIFGSLVLALKTDMKLSERNKLYAKVGAEFYNYEFELFREKIIDEDGVGLFLEAGWEYRWDNGMGVNAAIQYHNLGDLEMETFNLGVSYAF